MFLVICQISLAGGLRAQTPTGFAAGPYILDVSQNEATVAVHLQSAAPVQIIVFNDTKPSIFESPQTQTSHFVRINGLEPGRTYRYGVRTGDGHAGTPPGDPTYQVKTAGRPGDSFHFVVYGDPRPGESGTQRYHKGVVAEVVAAEPAFSLVLGDMVDDGSNRQLWETFFDIESELLRRTAIYSVLGDNDVADGQGVAADYFPKLSEGYYHFSWAGVHFFALNAWDTRGRQPVEALDENSGQIRWLLERLSRPEVKQAPYRIVFLHDPVRISRGRSAGILKQLWAPLLEQYGVDLVFASWHLYERSHHNGVTYIISGGAGAELIWMAPDPAYPSHADARAHHYCRVDVSQNLLTIRSIGLDGTVLDEFSVAPRSDPVAHEDHLKDLARRVRREIRISAGIDQPTMVLRLFATDCAFCRRLLERILPMLAKQYGVTLQVHYYDMGLPESYDLLLSAGANFGRQNTELPCIFAGSRVLGGEKEIKAALETEIAAFVKNPAGYADQALAPFGRTRQVTALKEDKYNALTLGLVMGAGLLDGLNPCAFTTIIFLISYMTLFGAGRRRILLAGIFFTLGVYLTYLLIGIAFFHSLKNILLSSSTAMVINFILLAAVIILAFLSLIDFFRTLRRGMSDAILKLPAGFRARIEAYVRNFADKPALSAAAPFMLGAVVSGLELTCTGQVYIPIVTMLANPDFRLKGLLYLSLYNMAFILPLVVVFVMAAIGITSAKTAKNRHFTATVKLGHAALFSVMAVILIHNMGWI